MSAKKIRKSLCSRFSGQRHCFLRVRDKTDAMNRKQKEKRETPIVDGDARRDMPVDVSKNKKNKHKAVPDKKFESERTSDINSLEDFKDAK